jgi:hypothetical protein
MRRATTFLKISAVAFGLLLAWTVPIAAEGDYPWLSKAAPGQSIRERIPTPAGYVRIEAPAGSFAAWLRELPLRPGRPPVRMYDGRLKPREDVHAAVVDLDVGKRDLQQCADTIIRLRAEYLWAMGRQSEIRFRFTSGHPAAWLDWAAGSRPVVSGNRVEWRPLAAPDASYSNFRAYLEKVYMYAGTISLHRELAPVNPGGTVEIGDVFIQPGSPGHAVLVVDVAAHPSSGRRAFLLLQGFTPAQEAHILVNPGDPGLSPWYSGSIDPVLETPEWSFRPGDRRRFPAQER